VLPGNQMGLLGSAAARTANDGRAAGSLLPPRKGGAGSPLLGRAATAAVEGEEAETSAMVRTQAAAAVWCDWPVTGRWRVWRAGVY
jgi:hypothetical protein